MSILSILLKKLLCLRNELRYNISDKSGDFVVLPQALDKKLGHRDLSDTTTYKRSSLRAFDIVLNELRNTTKRVLGKIMNARTVRRFTLTFPTVPTYYGLVKTHKLPEEGDLTHMDEDGIRTRPIISSCEGPSDRISWFLVKLLSPLLHHVAEHISNVEEFMSALNSCDLPTDVCYASFDAVSLHTNVNKDEAIHAVLELLQKHHKEVHIFGLTENDLRELLVATLACNIFQFDGEFYKQTRGLAMGLRISPLLAIVYLDRIERRSLVADILFYKRYVYDVFVISSTASALHAMVENLNSCDPNIHFTVETPDESGFLPYLNTKVKICEGTRQLIWYKKPLSKNILLHSRSAHPVYMKANTVKNLIVTKNRNCSQYSKEADEKVEPALEENGYTTHEAKSWRPHFAAGGIPLVLPYVNEQCARDVNRSYESRTFQ